MLHWLKWAALLLFAVAVLAAVMLATTGQYDVEINAKEFIISLKSTHKTREIGGVSDPKLAELVMRKMGKTNPINVSRAVTYSLQTVEQDSITINARYEMELSNRGTITMQAQEEDLELGLSVSAPRPEVLVDNVVLNPTDVSTAASGQVMRVYRVTLVPGQTKKVIYTLRGQKLPLPHTYVDVTTRPTLRSEFIWEGAPDLMTKIHIEATGLTWRDNWEKITPERSNHVVYIWRTIKYPLFPYQGAYVTIQHRPEP